MSVVSSACEFPDISDRMSDHTPASLAHLKRSRQILQISSARTLSSPLSCVLVAIYY